MDLQWILGFTGVRHGVSFLGFVVCRFIYPDIGGTCPVTGRDRRFLKTPDKSGNYISLIGRPPFDYAQDREKAAPTRFRN